MICETTIRSRGSYFALDCLAIQVIMAVQSYKLKENYKVKCMAQHDNINKICLSEIGTMNRSAVSETVNPPTSLQ